MLLHQVIASVPVYDPLSPASCFYGLCQLMDNLSLSLMDAQYSDPIDGSRIIGLSAALWVKAGLVKNSLPGSFL